MEEQQIFSNSARLIRMTKSADGILHNETECSKFYKKSFYTFGYFDELTYFKCKENIPLSYEECFAIREPNDINNQNNFSDQLFCIYDDSQETDLPEPFEYEGQDKPFLGLILVSVNKIDYDNFSLFLNNGIKSIKRNILSLISGISRVYKTLNCADICIVIRTDDMNEIYKTALETKSIFKDMDAETNISAVQSIQIFDNFIPNQKVLQANKDIIFELRTNKHINFENEFGILGSGGFTHQEAFEEYFSNTYRTFMSKKKNTDQAPTEFIYERILFPLKDISFHENDVDVTRNENIANSYVQNLRNILNKIMFDIYKIDISSSISHYKYKMKDDIILINGLINTFCDLWYQFPVTNGVMFYVQLNLILKNISEVISILNSCNNEKTKNKYWQLLQTNTSVAIKCITNYNKILQTMTQDSVNYPTHEIQVMVNTEKYIAAYNAYLHNICKDFYSQYGNLNDFERRTILPIVLMDMNERDIQAWTLFDQIDDNDENESKKRMSLYAVIFPNYKQFANIKHVLPLLTHELSHEFRYMDRITRNSVIVSEIIKVLSKQIMTKMISYAKLNAKASGGPHKKLCEELNSVLKCILLDKYKDKFTNWHIHEINQKFEEIFTKEILSFSDSNDDIVYNTNRYAEIQLNREVVQKNLRNIICKMQAIENSYCESSIKFDYKYYYKLIDSLNADSSSHEEEIDIRSHLNKIHNDIVALLQAAFKEQYERYIEIIETHNLKHIKSNILCNYDSCLLMLEKYYNNYSTIQDTIFCSTVVDFATNLNVIGNIYPIKKFRNYADKNLEMIYNSLKKTNISDNKETRKTYEMYLHSDSYRNMFTTLGLYDENKDTFIKILKTVLKQLQGGIAMRAKDRIRCYEEVCADLGMCIAFKFTPFGYLRFLTHIFKQHEER